MGKLTITTSRSEDSNINCDFDRMKLRMINLITLLYIQIKFGLFQSTCGELRLNEKGAHPNPA